MSDFLFNFIHDHLFIVFEYLNNKENLQVKNSMNSKELLNDYQFQRCNERIKGIDRIHEISIRKEAQIIIK